MADWEDYYEILGVSSDASAEEIRDAYRYKAFVLHPDRLQESPERVLKQAEEELKRVNRAYAVLGNPERRRQYHSDWLQRTAKANETSPRISDKLRDIASKYSAKIKDEKIFFAPNIPERKLRNALQSYAAIHRGAHPLVLVDDTILGSAKDGWLLTDRGFHAHAQFAESVSLALQEMQDVTLEQHAMGHKILVNGVKVWEGNWLNKKFTAQLHDLLCEIMSSFRPDNAIKGSND